MTKVFSLISAVTLLLTQVSGAPNEDSIDSILSPYSASLSQHEYSQLWSQIDQMMNQQNQVNSWYNPQKRGCSQQNNNQNQKPGQNQNQEQNQNQVVDILYPPQNRPNQNQQQQKPNSNQNQSQQQQQKPNNNQQTQNQQQQQSQNQNQQQNQQTQNQSPSGDKCTARVPNNDPCSKSSARNQGTFSSPMNQPYPSGQCTEWADGRYKELFGVNALLNGDARLWVSDARRKGGFSISSTPSVGSMVITQPGVFGAGSTGHVGIVEKVYENGEVCVSNWNYPTPWKTTYIKQRGQANGVDYIQKNGVKIQC